MGTERLALLLTLLLPFAANAADTQVSTQHLPSMLDAYARAAGLWPLQPSGGDELRIWTIGYPGSNVRGFVISDSGVRICRTRLRYEDGVTTVAPASCKAVQGWRGRQEVMAELDTLAAIDGKRWSCNVMDGFDVYVEGLRNGRRFMLSASNPDNCDDADSKSVMRVLLNLPT